MTEDLSTALREFVAEEARAASATAPDPRREAAALAARVARRRAVRGGLAVSAAAAATVVVTLGLGAGSGRDVAPAPPAVPAPSASAGPSPAPTTTATPPAVPAPPQTPAPSPDGAAPVVPEAAQPLPDGLLETTDARWQLVLHRGHDDDGLLVSPTAVYLVGPDGSTYAVPVVLPAAPAIGPTALWYLEDWLPGTSRILVTWPDGSRSAVVDVRTGEVHQDLEGVAWNGARFLRDGSGDVLASGGAGSGDLRRVTPAGDVRAAVPVREVRADSLPWRLSPDASAVLLNPTSGPAVLTSDDLAPVALAPPYPDLPDACRGWGWVAPGEVLLECDLGGARPYTPGMPTEFWLGSVGGDAPRPLTGMPGSTSLGGVWRVGDRLVAGTWGPREDRARWWEVVDGGLTPLSDGGTPEVDVVGVVGDRLLAVTSEPGAARDEGSRVSSLVVVDPLTGDTRSLLTTHAVPLPGFSVVPRTLQHVPPTEIGD
jgi:hypothetical protein